MPHFLQDNEEVVIFNLENFNLSCVDNDLSNERNKMLKTNHERQLTCGLSKGQMLRKVSQNCNLN